MGLIMAVALASGIAAAGWLRPHPALIMLALVLLAWLAGRSRGLWLLLLTLALFGALRYAWVQTAGRGSLAAWQGERITLTGTVVSEPEVRPPNRVSYVVETGSGRVYLTQRGGRAPGYGERVEAKGRLDRPVGPRTPGGYDQAAYLARQGVYLVLETGEVRLQGPGDLDPLRRAAVATRLRLEGVLHRALPAREAALLAGLLFGSRSELPDDIKESFRQTGVFHLLAVSGGNVAMLIIPLLALLRRAGMGVRGASATAVPVVIFFVFLTGASPSVMRAGLMAVLVLLGDVLERERDALNTLGVACALLLVWSPGLLFDLGFQLSAGATLGILLFARRIEAWLSPRLQPLVGPWVGAQLAMGLSATFAAQVMVEPLSLHQFGALSLIAPLANLLVLLFVGWLVPVGLVVVVAGLAWAPAAWLLKPVAVAGLTPLIYAVKAMATIPLAYLEVGRLPALWVVAWYAALALWLAPAARRAVAGRLLLLRAARRDHRLAAAVALLALAATALTWRHALAAPSDRLVVTYFDVGQGDAALVQVPGGRTLLIDAGQAYPPKGGRPGFDAGEEVLLPHLARSGLRRLDYLLLTHPDSDHVGGGAAVLRGVEVGALLVTSPEAPERGQAEALAVARERGVPVRLPVEGERWELGGGVVVEVLGPPRQPFTGTRSDDNANCIALRLRYRERTLLFACDLEAVAEERLAAAGVPLKADVLKVAHHGSAHSSTPAFLQAVGPRYAVISAGRANPFGHPHDKVLDRLRAVGAEVWRTDLHGTVTVETDGFALKVRGSRGTPERDGYRPLALLGRRLLRAW
ncbi:MAG: DNA internalization-related competence protein ComEC/Rec2 [Bacillota bacterium]